MSQPYNPDQLAKVMTPAQIAEVETLSKAVRREEIRARCKGRGGLLEFMKEFWYIVEPGRALVTGWVLEAICDHLEAVTFRDINRLLINVPPGSTKSMTADVFWPAWEWGPMGMATTRYICASYSQHLTVRDNRRFRRLIMSQEYRELWGDVFGPAEDAFNVVLVGNDRTGWKLATSVGGTGTGERADRVICLPYRERVLTNIGYLPIGDIVTQKMSVSIAGYDGDGIVWQTITNFQRNPTGRLVRVATATGRTLTLTERHRVYIVGRGKIEARDIRPGDEVQTDLSDLRNNISHQAKPSSAAEILQQGLSCERADGPGASGEYPSLHRLQKGGVPGSQPLGEDAGKILLQPQMPWDGKPRRGQPQIRQRALGRVRGLRKILPESAPPLQMLLSKMCGSSDIKVAEGAAASELRSRQGALAVPAWVDQNSSRDDTLQRRISLPRLRDAGGAARPETSRAPHRLCQGEPRPEKLDNDVCALSRQNARVSWAAEDLGREIVTHVELTDEFPPETFNLTVEPCHNYFASGVLVANCDDGNNPMESESDAVTESTSIWFREVIPDRLNHLEESAIINIQQRTSETDISGIIISEQLGYEWLMIPMEYDPGRHCVTSIGWQDPRGLDDDGNPLSDFEREQRRGILAWPERFSSDALMKLYRAKGEYAVSGQYQQLPTPRGGGLFKREWIEPWPPLNPDGSFPHDMVDAQRRIRFPALEYVIGWVDTAFTENQENDYCAMSVLGIFRAEGKGSLVPKGDGTYIRIADDQGYPKAIVLHAWQKRVTIHGPPEEIPMGVTKEEWNSPRYLNERKKLWGLVEWVADTVKRYRIDYLGIETQALGHTLEQELHRLHRDLPCVIETVPARGDKVARGYAVQGSFSSRQIYFPTYEDGSYPSWLDPVADQLFVFPKGQHDDLVDTLTGGIKHLRDTGMFDRREEFNRDEEASMIYRPGQNRIEMPYEV